MLDYHVTADSLSEMYPTKIRGHMKERRSCDAKVPKAIRAATWEVVSPRTDSSSRETKSMFFFFFWPVRRPKN